MTPVLIDRSAIHKITLVFCLMAAVMFAAGYWSGARQTGEPVTLSAVIDDMTVAEQELSAEQVSSASVPDTAPQQIIKEPVTLHNEQAVQQVQLAMLDIATDPPYLSASQQQALALPAAAPGPGHEKDKQPVQHAVARAEQQTEISSETVAYIIQAGVYADQQNAVRLRDELTQTGFDVYVSDYLNRLNEKRYSVRIGPYASEMEAKADLLVYQQQSDGAGYIIKVEH